MARIKQNTYSIATHKLQGKIVAQSSAALKFLVVPEGQKYDTACTDEYDSYWFPLSQIRAIHETFSVVNETLDSIVISLWIAKQKGIIA